MREKTKNFQKAIILFGIIIVVFSGLMLYITYWLTPNIQFDFTNSATNSSFLFNNSTDPFHVSIQSVPTVINGVTTATSIIIGFSVALVGIIASQLLKDDEKDRKIREYLVGSILFVFPAILLIDFGAYMNLLIGSKLGFITAIQYVLMGFVLSLLLLVGIFIGVWLIIEEHKARTLPLTQLSQQQDKQEIKNVAVNTLNEPKKKDPETTKEIWIASEENIDKDFEETRRCLLNSYHSYVQNHVGYMIAIVVGLVGLVSSSENFFKIAFGNYFFIFLVLLIFGAAFYDYLRIKYWTSFANSALTLPKNRAINLFNVHNQDPQRIKPYLKIEPALNEAILQIAIDCDIRDFANNKTQGWLTRKRLKLMLKTAG